MKHAFSLAGMFVVAVVFYLAFVLVLEGQWLLPQRVIPVAGVRLDQWLESFKMWAGMGIAAAFLASFLWYVVAQIVYRVNNLSDAATRVVWFLFMLIPALMATAGSIFTRQAQAGMTWAYVFYFLNSLLCYYVATVFFSPSSHKYTPLLASALRPSNWIPYSANK